MSVEWLTDALHLAQFALGTMLLSSVLFLRVQDAIVIVLRYLVSAAAVRVVVEFEVGALRSEVT